MDTLPPTLTSTETKPKHMGNQFLLFVGLALVLLAFVLQYGQHMAANDVMVAPETVTSEGDAVVQLEEELQPPTPSSAYNDQQQSTLTFRSSHQLTKVINGTQFAFIPAKYSGEYSKDLATLDVSGQYFPSSDPFLSTLGSYISDRTQDFWIDQANLVFYLIDARPESSDETTTLFELKFEPNDPERKHTLTSKKIIAFLQRSNVYELTKILSLQPTKQLMVLMSGSGDGCGGQGTVWKLDTQSYVRTDILKYGIGCAPGPGFGGLYHDGRLIIAERQPTQGSDDADWSTDTYTSLYLLNPETMGKEVLSSDGKELAGYHILQNDTQDFARIPMSSLEGNIIFTKDSADHGPLPEFRKFDPTTKQLLPL